MQMFETATYDIHIHALSVAAKIGVSEAAPGVAALHSPITDKMMGWVERIWEQVDGAI